MKLKKGLWKFGISAIVCLLVMGCGKAEKDDGTVKVALVTTTGGLGDRSFSDSAWEGFKKAEAELGVVVKVMEPQSVADYQTTVSSISSAGYDFVLGAGTDQFDALEMCSSQYPDTRYGAININLEADNLQVCRFADHEGAFLAGALAAMCSKTGTIGFVGGSDVPTINRFFLGYEEGALYVDPDIKVLSSYVGSFADPGKGKEFTKQLISQGADIIFHAAGKTGEGVFEAIKEYEDVYAIGVDQNQDHIVKGKILTSVEKRVNVAAYEMIESIVNGTFETGYKQYGLKEQGVGLTDMEYTRDYIGEERIQKVKELEQKIIDGEIVVTDFFDTSR